MKDSVGKNISKNSPQNSEINELSSPIPISSPEKKKSRINTERYKVEIPLSETNFEPLWVSVSEAAKIGGVQSKTIRRAIQADLVQYKVINDRYSIDLGSVIRYLYTSTKLKNKIENNGIAKYIENWKK
ncbi:hypothetical protein C0584_04080 [Candidatus Parcubacteria bacterium]|mgnify:CR=1 FL=1|nr:MAG: hypothetical protein C0584_04080 [Candidatus Parcubacteria bacterium]